MSMQSSIPILAPENSFNMTCDDKTCAAIFAAPRPIPEIINQTQLLPIIIYHQAPIVCPKCGATYRLLVNQVQTNFVVHKIDTELIQQARVLPFGNGH